MKLTLAQRDLLWVVAQHKYGWAHCPNAGRERRLQTAQALQRRGLVSIGGQAHMPTCAATDRGREEIARRWPVSPFILRTYDHQPGGWTPRDGVSASDDKRSSRAECVRRPDSRSAQSPEAAQEPQATLAGQLPRVGLSDPASLVGLAIRDVQGRQVGRVTHVSLDDPAGLSFRAVLEGPASREVRALLSFPQGLDLLLRKVPVVPEGHATPEHE